MARHVAGHLTSDYGAEFQRWNWHRSRVWTGPWLWSIKSDRQTASGASARQAAGPSQHRSRPQPL